MQFRKFIFSSVVLVVLAVSTHAQQPDDFTPLFNGKDLTGWTKMAAGEWVVQDGAIRYQGTGNGWLRTNDQFKDFQVIAEWRYVNEGNNDSGFFVRAALTGNPWPSPSYQVNMGPGQNFGSMSGKGSKARFDLIKKVGEWNSYDLIMIGDKATLMINDHKAWDAYALPRTEAGYIGLQCEGFVVEFRNIRIRKLGEPRVTAAVPKESRIKEVFSGNDTKGPFALSFRPITDRSETILVADKLLLRDLHYSIDYPTGVITFNRVIGLNDTIQAEYKYTLSATTTSSRILSAVQFSSVSPGLLQNAVAGAKLDDLVASGAKVELVKDGFKFTEGPMCGNRGSIYFSNIPDNQICRINTTGDPMVTVVHENTDGANGLFMNKDGVIIAACGTGKIVAFNQDKSKKVIADSCGGKPLNRPNDLTVAKDGRIYFTAPGARPMPGQTPDPKPSVHLIKPDGAVVLLDDTVMRPNGILLSLDEKTLFVLNTMGEYVLAYDVQPDGTVKGRRNFAKLRDVQANNSGADGMCLDQQSNLYVTCNTGVQVFNAKGDYLGNLVVPKKPSNCAFAGVADRKTLYITAQDSIFKIRMNAEGPKDRAK